MAFLNELDDYCKKNHDITFENLQKKYENQLLSYNSAFFQIYPPETYDLIMTNYTKYVSDTYIDTKLSDYANRISNENNPEILVIYHRYVLLHLIANIENHPRFLALTEELKKILLIYFQGIIKRIESNVKDFFVLPQFNRYLFYCTLKSIPIGSHYVSVEGIPHKFLYAGGFKQALRSLYLLLFKLGGFKPYYRIHLAEHNNPYVIKEFNERGWNEMFRQLQPLVEADKKIRGVSGTSWWFDPALENISPEIAYFRHSFLKNNGLILKLNTNNEVVRDATIFNNKRKQAYLSGEYLPYQYLAIFDRKTFLNIKF